MVFKFLLWRDLCIGLFWLLCSTSAIASSFKLENNTWELIAFPYPTEEFSLAEIVGPELSPSDYGVTWTVFTYDSISHEYVHPSLDTVIANGEALWIIQITGSTIMMEAPNQTINPQVIGDSVQECGRSIVPLSTAGEATSWNMIGVPFSAPLNLADLYFNIDDTSERCSFYSCDFSYANQEGYVDGTLYMYDSLAQSYSPITGTDEIPSWQGIWLAMQETVRDKNSYVLFSDPAENSLLDEQGSIDTVAIDGCHISFDKSDGIRAKLGDGIYIYLLSDNVSAEKLSITPTHPSHTPAFDYTDSLLSSFITFEISDEASDFNDVSVVLETSVHVSSIYGCNLEALTCEAVVFGGKDQHLYEFRVEKDISYIFELAN